MTSELDRQMASPMGRPTMSEPISDAELARIKQYGVSFGLKLYRHEADALFARLAAAEAERDAAVKKHDDLVNYLQRDKSVIIVDALKEGERRATAAIVAWLRDDAADGKTQFQLARAIRRGDHLKGTSNE